MKQNEIYCSFCGKDKEKTNKLIAGPDGVYICDECVCLCVDLLSEIPGIENKNRYIDAKEKQLQLMLDKLYQANDQLSQAIEAVNDEIISLRKKREKPHD